MYVVVNITPGADMSLLMETLAARTLTFSVTDDLSKLCGKCSRDSQPLPVPHQEPTPPSLKQEASTPSSSQVVQGSNDLSKIWTPKARAPRRRGIEEEVSLSSEPDPAGDECPAKKAVQLAWKELAQATSLLDGNSLSESCLFQTPKEEPGSSSQTSGSIGEANAMVSDLFKKIEQIAENSGADETVNNRSTKDMFRGECRICQMPISIRTHHMRRHAMKHLGFKTYICQLCQKDFNRSDLCKSHFERYHPSTPLIPFQDTITAEQQEKLEQMIIICFPDEHKVRGNHGL